MPISTTATAFMTNLQIKPLFLEYTAIILIKNYTDSIPFCCRSLTKDAVVYIITYGLSIYAYDEKTNRYSKLVSAFEWCHVELTTEVPEHAFEEASVMAKEGLLKSKICCALIILMKGVSSAQPSLLKSKLLSFLLFPFCFPKGNNQKNLRF